jgi:hypothetical protein
VRVLGDENKTVNLLRSHLSRFDTMTADFPLELRQEMWDLLRGSALTRGIPCERRVFAKIDEVPKRVLEPHPMLAATPLSEPKKEAEPKAEPVDRKTIEPIAKADAFADRFLKSLGLD